VDIWRPLSKEEEQDEEDIKKRQHLQFIAQHVDFHKWIGIFQGKTVSTVSVWMNKENRIAAIHTMATIVDERRKGFGKAILGRAIDFLRDERILHVVLQAESPGVPLYESFGFVQKGNILWLEHSEY